jgi:general secretion pathway protein A
MYKDHFQLRAMPFSIAPDPTYFYLSNQHRDALTLLRHAVTQSDGVTLLTGEVGAGKTTVCRRFLEELPSHVDAVFIYNPRLTPTELLATVCESLQVAVSPEDASLAALTRALLQRVENASKTGRSTLLVIDEAQGLGTEAIDRLRLLVEAGRDAGLRVALIGQPELKDLLADTRNARFNELITMRHHLGPLDFDDLQGYVRTRLEVAGSHQQLFPPRLMRTLHRMSGGIPRVVNIICDRALLATCVLGKKTVTSRVLAQARAEVVGRDTTAGAWGRLAPRLLGGLAAVAASAGLALAVHNPGEPPPSVMSPATTQGSVADLDPSDPSDWPDGMGGTHSEALAFAALLKRWNLPAIEEPVCRARLKTGLKCVQGSDEFEDLRRLNTPAVLQLMDRQGRRTDVALVQLRRDHAVLQLGDTVRRVPIAVLESQWTRRYTLLWRPPASVNATVVVGASGPGVDWIRDRIAQWKGLEARNLPSTLDGALKAHLQAFQTMEGLRATGAGDLRTLVHLAVRTEKDAPTLETARCER